MAISSDSESDTNQIPDSVTNYEFVNGEDEPVPFSDLPQLEKFPISTQIYLRGKTEDGLKKVCEPVIGWKLDVSRDAGPESFISLMNGKWIKLLEPRKIYEGVIRSILISIQMLHFVKFNSNLEETNLWGHLRFVFDKFERKPSEDDLIPHLSFIKEFAEQDEILAKSLLLKGFLERNSSTRTTGEDENDLFDNVCCICDNGGELLCCEGNCMRSFHATKEAGEESNCKSLGLSESQLDAIKNFICKNCKLKQHQCFLCGKLGNSDKTKVQEVFQCSNTTCGYFYHPKCISKQLYKDDEFRALKCEKNISENGKFICPYHKCSVCKELEEKDDFALQFAVCRRCPRSYHRKCLPTEISFEDERLITRAWEDLLPNNRILIYCMKHKMDKDLGTPPRNHIKFPDKIRILEKQKIQVCQNKIEEGENKKEERENKKEKRENKKEERENRKEKRENKKDERESECVKNEAKKRRTGVKNTVENRDTSNNNPIREESMKMCHVYQLPSLGGAGTSASVMDRYTPRLEETNAGRPGPWFDLGFGGFSPIYCYDMNGVIRRDLPPYKGPPPGLSCGWISD